MDSLSEALPKIKEGFFHNLAPKKEKKIKERRHGGGGRGLRELLCDIYSKYIRYIFKGEKERKSN